MTADGVAVERLRPIAHRVLLRMLILHARGGLLSAGDESSPPEVGRQQGVKSRYQKRGVRETGLSGRRSQDFRFSGIGAYVRKSAGSFEIFDLPHIASGAVTRYSQ
jgi:hypothetical protein